MAAFHKERLGEIMELAGKKVLIIGLGKTGLATARFLAGRDASVFATDEKPRGEVEEICRKEGIGAGVKIANYDPTSLADVELIVPSPGVPPSNPILAEDFRQKIPI